ncbi:MAG: DUF5666 domain-containing protein, partial [Vicinamibacterales bacterium]
MGGGMFKFAHVAAMAVATFFVASVGLVAAAGGTDLITAPFGGGDHGDKFEATVISVSETLFFVRTDSDFAFLHISDETRFEDSFGNVVDQSAIQVQMRIGVRATHRSGRFWDAHTIRLLDGHNEPTPVDAPKPEQTHDATPKPPHEATPKPTAEATHKPEPTVKPTDKPVETPKPTQKPGCEFFGGVTAITEHYMTVQADLGAVTVWTSGETQFPNGYPFVGVKVAVLGTKNDDGSCNAGKITVKIVEFSGTFQSATETAVTITVDTYTKTVHVNSSTQFPNGFPVAGDYVTVRAYLMMDGSKLASHVTVTVPPTTVFI